jgi:hypothetical protein
MHPQESSAWHIDDSRRFQTESKRNYYDKPAAPGNPYDSAVKMRRPFDIFGAQSMVKAQKKNVLNEKRYNKERVAMVHEMSTRLYNEEEYILTPCRFAPSGWKYVKKV